MKATRMSSDAMVAAGLSRFLSRKILYVRSGTCSTRQDRKEANVDDAFLEQRLLLGAQNMAPTHSACLE
jgi:hypothetical protein